MRRKTFATDLDTGFAAWYNWYVARTMLLVKETGVDLEAMRKIADENMEVLIRKNSDYGSDNLLATGVRGVAVRLLDKVNRLLTLTAERRDPNFESIEDTFGDVANYGVIGQAMRRGLLERKALMVYLAGPIDLAVGLEAFNWRSEAARYLATQGHSCFNPAMAFLGANIRCAEQVEFVNRAAISRCDVLIANLTERLSFGTIREIEFAKDRGRRVIVASTMLGTSFAAYDVEVVPSVSRALELLAPELPEDDFGGTRGGRSDSPLAAD